ncbi:MAG TPA: ComF family protein [Burkholderiaceae bacterium]|nr:ComF family protein [Burkholderiaceae bacterium]
MLPSGATRRWLAAAIDPWLPRSCLLCEAALLRDECGMCGGCRGALAGAGGTRCRCCGQAGPPDDAAVGTGDFLCGDCAATTPAFDRTHVLADYRAPLDRAIVTMKFRHKRAIGSALGDTLAEHLLKQAGEPAPELVVAVPLSLERLLERGFNPAQVIAARVARRLGLPAPRPLLRRLWHTGSQSGLGLRERRDNVEGVFDCDEAAGRAISGRAVLLVDDVMTTGATLQAAADALKCAGARAVVNAVIARTPRNRIVSG